MIVYAYISCVLLLIAYSCKKTKSIYPIIYITTVTLPYLYQQFKIPGLEWINVALIYGTVLFVIYNGKQRRFTTDFNSHYFIILLVLYIASSLGTYGSFMDSAHWGKTYPLGFLLLYAIVHKPFKQNIFYERLFLFLWVVQVVLVFSWACGLNLLPNFRVSEYNWYDYALGTLGFHMRLADFMIFGICYYLPEYLEKRKKQTLIKLALFLWIFMLTHNRHLLPILPLTIMVQMLVYYLRKGFTPRRVLYSLGIAAIAIFGLMVVLNFSFGSQRKFSLNVSLAETARIAYDVSNMMITLSSKTDAYRNAYNYMADSNILRIVIGYGPGTFGSLTSQGVGGSLFKALIVNSLYGLRTDPGGNISISDTVTNDFIGIGTEFGVLGIICFYSFFFYIAGFAYRKSKLLNNYVVEMSRIVGIISYVLLVGMVRDIICTGPFVIASILIGYNLNRLIAYKRSKGYAENSEHSNLSGCVGTSHY